MAAALGSVLKLKPVMRLTEDGTRLDKFFVKRTMSAAVSGIMDHMKKKGIDGRYLLYIVHAAAPKEAGAIREMIEAEFKGIQIQDDGPKPCIRGPGRPRVRGHPVYRTIGIKRTGTFRGMRLPGSVPVFFGFLAKGEGTGPDRFLFCNGHRSDVRVYALIPVKDSPRRRWSWPISRAFTAAYTSEEASQR